MCFSKCYALEFYINMNFVLVFDMFILFIQKLHGSRGFTIDFPTKIIVHQIEMETHPDRPNDYEFLSLSLDDEFKTSTTFDFEPGVSNRIYFFMTPAAKKWRDWLEKSWTIVLIEEPSARDHKLIFQYINLMRLKLFT